MLSGPLVVVLLISLEYTPVSCLRGIGTAGTAVTRHMVPEQEPYALSLAFEISCGVAHISSAPPSSQLRGCQVGSKVHLQNKDMTRHGQKEPNTTKAKAPNPIASQLISESHYEPFTSFSRSHWSSVGEGS